MQRRLTWAAFVCVAAWAGPALAEEEAKQQLQDRRIASRAFEILNTINSRSNGQVESAVRRCKAYMQEASSAEKLGSKEMAGKNWDKAARGCKSDAMVACRTQKAAAPPEQCALVK